MGHCCSLGPAFASAFHAVRNAVSPAFVLFPLLQISDPDEPSFGRPCFLFVGVPPQPNYPPAAVPLRVSNTKHAKRGNIGASTTPGEVASAAPAYAW